MEGKSAHAVLGQRDAPHQAELPALLDKEAEGAEQVAHLEADQPGQQRGARLQA